MWYIWKESSETQQQHVRTSEFKHTPDGVPSERSDQALPAGSVRESLVRIASGHRVLEGDLWLPGAVSRLVLFAHGSGSSRHSPRNRMVAGRLQQAGLGTLLFDLLTREEEAAEALTGRLRFDIELLAQRLLDATGWARKQGETRGLAMGYFGASTGAAAALVAAAKLPETVRAVVSRGGRPDLAGGFLSAVICPTLLIVGERDPVVLDLNRQAAAQLKAPHQLVLVPRASHLFEERGALDRVAELAADWFRAHLGSAPTTERARGSG
jgi:pimeloyl-ACP methyl ester carboxylesterase